MRAWLKLSFRFGFVINVNLNVTPTQNLCTAQVVNVTPRYARLKAADDREVQHPSAQLHNRALACSQELFKLGSPVCKQCFTHA